MLGTERIGSAAARALQRTIEMPSHKSNVAISMLAGMIEREDYTAVLYPFGFLDASLEMMSLFTIQRSLVSHSFMRPEIR